MSNVLRIAGSIIVLTLAFVGNYATAKSPEQATTDQANFTQHKETAGTVERVRNTEPKLLMVENRLLGEWVIDVEKTTNFLFENYKKMPVWVDISACSLHSVKLSLDEKTMTLSYFPGSCKLEGEQKVSDGWNNTFRYGVLFSGEKQTALRLDGERGAEARVVNWIAVNQFWVDEGSETEVMRYYFMRSK